VNANSLSMHGGGYGPASSRRALAWTKTGGTAIGSRCYQRKVDHRRASGREATFVNLAPRSLVLGVCTANEHRRREARCLGPLRDEQECRIQAPVGNSTSASTGLSPCLFILLSYAPLSRIRCRERDFARRRRGAPKALRDDNCLQRPGAGKESRKTFLSDHPNFERGGTAICAAAGWKEFFPAGVSA
jgi:hypothetical protein